MPNTSIVDSVESLNHALKHQVPDMLCGFTIKTYFGEISVHGRDAVPFFEEMKRLLEEKVQQIHQQEQ
ncbi:hypothetical protein [Serratia marcescens]|uniref:hypothetical protein n=1 Tax=Serratia marcescens TaxID=615 RepID=UPI00074511E5|nr:hypothetical protein [Serratia marcescens]AYJ94894.1 hypothetical protein D9K64_18025 [Klebsiella pneumoniae]RLO18426.1 hypothetical protein D1220_22985 [Klebsiella pneumoniae]CVC14665.1 Uncharacterised protein [Serratia marcescens]